MRAMKYYECIFFLHLSILDRLVKNILSAIVKKIRGPIMVEKWNDQEYSVNLRTLIVFLY